VLSTLIQEIFRRCFRYFLAVKKLLCRPLPGRIDCCRINYSSTGNDRVSKINRAAPDCVCEQHRMSKFSPQPVRDDEKMTRFVFIESHLRKDRKSIKPSFFSHVDTKGCSIQRESIVGDSELVDFVKKFNEKNPGRDWFGVVIGNCQDIRRISTEQNQRACCVYDTGEEYNPAHGEICKTHHIEEADKAELRRELIRVFNNGQIIEPNRYRDGKIHAKF